MTSYRTIKTNVIKAGGQWEDSAVVADNGVDLDAFSAKIIEEVKDGKRQRRAA